MAKFNYEMSIEAATEEEAQTKMAALVTLAAKLKTIELARLANIVKNDPIKTAMAKKYLEYKMKRATAIEKDRWTAKEIMLYTAGSIVLLGGGFLLARHIVQTEKEKKVEKKSAEEGSPESYVKALKWLLKRWMAGNKYAGSKTCVYGNTQQRVLQEVSSNYQKLYHTPLTSDLSSELQSSEINEVLSILAAKPDKLLPKRNNPVYNFSAWAKRLKAAFDKTYGFIPGTDEPAIKAVFYEIPTQAAFVQVANAYLNQYHNNLLDDLQGELEIWEYPDYMKIITSKPKN